MHRVSYQLWWEVVYWHQQNKEIEYVRNRLRNSAYEQITYSTWFQAFAVFRMLFVFFWVIPRRLIYICRHFGTLYLFHLQRQAPAFEDGTDRVFRNVGIYKSDAGESPKRKQTTFWTGRKLEIKNICFMFVFLFCMFPFLVCVFCAFALFCVSFLPPYNFTVHWNRLENQLQLINIRLM